MGLPVILDATPLAGGHGVRGIGAAVRGLIHGFASVPETERPLLMLPAGSDVPGGFRALGVSLPSWPLARLNVPDPWPGFRGGRVVRRAAPRLVHATHGGFLPRDVPTVASCYDTVPLRLPALYLAGAGRWAQRVAYGRMLARLREARRIVVPTEASANDVVELGGVAPGRVRVVPLGAVPPVRIPATGGDPALPGSEGGGAGLEDHAPAPPGDGRPYLLYSGALEPHKNPGVLVDALARMDPEIVLVMAGPWSRRRAARLHARVTARGLEDRVHLRGYVPSDELARLRRGALAVCVPSLVEGWGFPATEAMAAGVPVLVSDAAALVEVTAGACPVVPARVAEAWAAAVHEMLRNPGHREEVVRRGRARAADLTWERSAAETLAVYREALDE